MGKRVYISKADEEAYELLRSLFQSACEAGGMFGKEYGDDEGHEDMCEKVERLTKKIQG